MINRSFLRFFFFKILEKLKKPKQDMKLINNAIHDKQHGRATGNWQVSDACAFVSVFISLSINVL